ncbi:UNVERIFIED_CONTAM: hypothetical protein K2H54_000126 [Gekko kuhli]
MTLQMYQCALFTENDGGFNEVATYERVGTFRVRQMENPLANQRINASGLTSRLSSTGTITRHPAEHRGQLCRGHLGQVKAEVRDHHALFSSKTGGLFLSTASLFGCRRLKLGLVD